MKLTNVQIALIVAVVAVVGWYVYKKEKKKPVTPSKFPNMPGSQQAVPCSACEIICNGYGPSDQCDSCWANCIKDA